MFGPSLIVFDQAAVTRALSANRNDPWSLWRNSNQEQ